MKISKKKETELYNLVSEEIMQARIKIAFLFPKSEYPYPKIDDILSGLTINCPQKVIDLFSEKKSESTRKP